MTALNNRLITIWYVASLFFREKPKDFKVDSIIQFEAKEKP